VSERFLTRAGYRPAKRWELDSNEAIKRSVAAGLGIGFVSELVVADELTRGELMSFRLEGADPMRRSVYLLRPDGREPTPSERAFIQTLCSCCSASVAGRTANPVVAPRSLGASHAPAVQARTRRALSGCRTSPPPRCAPGRGSR